MSLYDVCNEAGGMTQYEWDRDPRRLAFILSRYAFVAKMLAGKDRVLEIGCADGFGSRLVRQTVGHLTAIDMDGDAIASAKEHVSPNWPITFKAMSFNESFDWFDAVYALDVLEHIQPEFEYEFLIKMYSSGNVAIIGTPSFESQAYASLLSREGHVNCKTEDGLRVALRELWPHVFMFGMNDTTLHVGFGPMCHYRFALCVR